ncbi:esterase/lipase family protein [Mycolicibacterium sediminis]|uniref:AB hydrolase-1 domain-containing protein n=1 Tax=Mycolicibacterium sediminis TaxID=1286180 RepID=A0A7I7QPD5_9MYCO|nr:alpha/beta fold hydrolase [Mycolicibacterium sediminis]BBY28174.1 hypothetical protein MSEDJ_22700 [Mycolicibacterium sediminis]
MRVRPVGYAGFLLGSTAAALLLGAGIAQADEGPSAATAGAPGASSEQSKATSGLGPTAGTGPAALQGIGGLSGSTERTGGPTTGLSTPTTRVGNGREGGISATRSDDTPRSGRSTLISIPSTARPTTQRTATSPWGLTTGSTRANLSTVQPDTTGSSGAQLPTASPAPSIRLATTPSIPEPGHLVRQLTGLTVDVTAFGASFVNNIAVEVARGFGPKFLGGGPYVAVSAIADAAGNVSKVLTDTPLNLTSTGPFPVNYGVFEPLAWLNPNIVPAGANDPSITVTPEHPLPIILINGTAEPSGFNWSVGAPVLANAGYKVYTFDYGRNGYIPNFFVRGLGDIAVSAQELSDEIDTVLAETGAPQVILIGHSQGGGTLPAYYLNVLGGNAKVSQFIGIAPSNHGTDVNFLAYAFTLPVFGPLFSGVLGRVFPALEQQSITSQFQELVFGDGDTRPGTIYTTLVSTYDEVLTPYERQFLDGPNVTNIVLQDQYPGFLGGHLGVTVSPITWNYVLEALASNPAASPANPLMAPLIVSAA